MWDILLSNLPVILTVVISTAFVWKYVSSILVVAKEVKEFLNAILDAFADKKLTAEEMKTIIKEAKDIAGVIKRLLKK